LLSVPGIGILVAIFFSLLPIEDQNRFYVISSDVDPSARPYSDRSTCPHSSERTKKHLRIEPLHAGFENASKYKFCIMKLDIHLSACPSLIGGQARILVRGQKTKQKHLGIAPLPAGFCECKQILVLCNELMRGPKWDPSVCPHSDRRASPNSSKRTKRTYKD